MYLPNKAETQLIRATYRPSLRTKTTISLTYPHAKAEIGTILLSFPTLQQVE
jgi:hypothetical protein